MYVLGSEIYGDCIKYTVGEIKPVLTDGDRFCLQEQGYVYCKEFKCPPTVCGSPLVPENLKCQYCEGQFKLPYIFAQFLN